MPTWTKEQQQAISETGKNIIVSAGAGSGKTAVLSERVIEKLKHGIHINELLILTFTKAAAAEMKERIRKKIKKDITLKDELNLIDAAYITTFDSFSMSVVKKYHYLLNVKKDLSIIESSVIEIKKEELLDNIFNYYYEHNNNDFMELIDNYCIKDDTSIKKYILNINNKLDLKINKIDYLENYIENNYNDEKINKDIDKYVKLLLNKINIIKEDIDNLSLYVENNYIDKLNISLGNLLSCDNYDDIRNSLNIKLPTLPRGVEDEVKIAKEKLSTNIKELVKMCPYESRDEIYNSIMSTKNITSIICKIIIKLHKELQDYKHNLDVYEFNDIAIMAINILDNKEVRDELKYHFKEILVDEYQDTNDLQEAFINKIENDNVYMVGDIKQSIYRFRNANPYIFKNKYDKYSKLDGGIKIDLLKNFRSREEVLNNINIMFNLIMDDEIGGANYIEDHQMIFGNNTYNNEGHTIQNNDFEIYTYPYKDTKYSKEEIEIFTIANDIKKKIDSKYQVFDKDNLLLRDITYSDFVILIDRSTSFDLYKKIFEYLNIPLSILKDEKLNTDNDIIMLKNLINFIIKVKNNEFDTEFKYLFTSITRSFIYSYDDNTIFNYFVNNNFKDSILYHTSLDIIKKLDILSIRDIIDLVIDKFNYIERLMTIGNTSKSLIKLDYIKDIADNLNLLGYDIYMFNDYLKTIIDNDYKMVFNVNEEGSNSVKIMTIHKSKGLEYHICYFPGLYKEFNLMELKDKFTYDNEYGIITPYFDEGIGKTIYKELLKNKYKYEEISERIRLFYVAVTRAKEKIIVILPKNDKELLQDKKSIIDKNIRLNYKSFKDIFNSIENYIKEYYIDINIDNIGLTKDYNLIKNTNLNNFITNKKEQINVSELNIKNDSLEEETFSKKSNKIIKEEEKNNMEFGIKIHEILEYFDFKKKDYSYIEDEFIKDKVKKLCNNELFSNIESANIYKEYEFIYTSCNNKYHGIIDLMLEYDDHIDIIDYKLKNIDDDNYLKQLSGYKKYIENKTNKNTNIYLYSILDSKLNKL